MNPLTLRLDKKSLSLLSEGQRRTKLNRGELIRRTLRDYNRVRLKSHVSVVLCSSQIRKDRRVFQLLQSPVTTRDRWLLCGETALPAPPRTEKPSFHA